MEGKTYILYFPSIFHIKFIILLYISYRVQHASVPLITNPNFYNPQDATLNLQAAMKNLQTNAVFYFLIPNNLQNLFVPSQPLDITNLVNTWKGYDDSLEVSVLANGMFSLIIDFLLLIYVFLLESMSWFLLLKLCYRSIISGCRGNQEETSSS